MFSLSKGKSNTNISELIVNNTKILLIQKTCDNLNSYFCTVGEKLAAKISSNRQDFINYCDTPLPNSMFCAPVTPDEIKSIVSKFRNNKSPGSDNIGPKLLKSVLDIIVYPLVYLYNLSFSTGRVPEALKIAKVIPLFKNVIEQVHATTAQSHYLAFSIKY